MSSSKATVSRPLRIAIDCRITDVRQGHGMSISALAKALSDAPVDHQRYTFVVLEEMRGWIEPYLYGRCELASIAPSSVSRAKLLLRDIVPLRLLWKAVRSGAGYVPKSDGFLESKGFDLVHFPTQTAYLTDVPSIYQPWDLQHVHLPQFFSKDEFLVRERTYRAFCKQADFVCVQTDWTRKDVIANFGITEDKMVVIPWGSLFDGSAELSTEKILAARQKHSLADRYFFYPAVTWPHKNHELILHAVAQLRSNGVGATVYFSGAATPHLSTLKRLAAELRIEEQIRFLGFLDRADLQAILAGATAMIFPSRFEGFGMPVLEAFHAGVPVLASRASTLPEVAQDGALFFDPDAPEELARCMRVMLEEEEVRQKLIAKGAAILASHSMRDTAQAFQNLYDRVAEMRGLR